MGGAALVLHSINTSISSTDLSHGHVVNVVTSPYCAIVTLAALYALWVEGMLLILINVHIQMYIVAISFTAIFKSECIFINFFPEEASLLAAIIVLN